MAPLQLGPGEQACGDEPGWVCQRVFDATENETLAKLSDFLVEKPLKVALILVGAFLLNRIVRRAVNRFAAGLAGTAGAGALGRLRESAGEVNIRAAARAETLGAVLRSIFTAVIYCLAALTVLGEFGINLGPLIAGAGIVGVALGFGAQSLVKDFLAGMFILIEDQYGVGDIIDVGDATGTVEAVTLRTTRVRDLDGTVWHVPNGQIARVGNKSQQWARAVVDVSVAYGTDLRRAQKVVKRVADKLWEDEEWHSEVLEEPEVWGIENLGPDGIDIRLVVKTKPAAQFKVMRELRVRLNDAFTEEGIEIPSPQRTLWLRGEDGRSQTPESLTPDTAEEQPAQPPSRPE